MREGVGTSHPNIAFIKYWGKKCEEENIPMNGSVSQTLGRMCTETSVVHTEDDVQDDLISYGESEPTKVDLKASRVIKYFREITGDRKALVIRTKSNFPACCGLASSASGISALVLALDDFYRTRLPRELLSSVARMGSASAARSLHSGIVHMQSTHGEHVGEWEELRIFAVVVSSAQKRVGSTEGMRCTSRTSSLFQKRQEGVEKRLERILEAIREKRFREFALIVMQDSNEMHACCADSFPPIFYMNDRSRDIVEKIHELNSDEVIAAYTFDAGPNGFVVTLEPHYERVRRAFADHGFSVIEAL
jgi:diphosphomevalonate decarboxylase